MRLTAAVTAAIRRSLLWGRVVAAAAVALIAVRLAPSDLPVAAITFAGAALIVLVGVFERILRRLVGQYAASVAVVALDTAMTIAIVMLHDVQLTEPASVVLVLPLFEAAIRHGLLGVVVDWVMVSMVLVVRLALWQDVTTIGFGAPLGYLGMLLLVTLPAAHLCEYLIDLIDRYDAAHRSAQLRADVLAEVVDVTAELAAASSPAQIDSIVCDGATRLIPGCWTIIEGGAFSAHADMSAGAAYVTDGDVTLISLGVGGDPVRVLRGEPNDPPDAVALEAIEIMCVQARLCHHTTALHDQASREAETWERRARTDHLTGLLNRAGLVAHAGPLLSATAVPRAVIYFDLNGFKQINDRHGHQLGDRILQFVGQRLSASRPGALAARLGGDEFAMVTHLGPSETTADVTAALRRKIEHRVQHGGRQICTIRVSIGAITMGPGDSTSLEQALHAADLEMYTQKRRRRTDPPAARLAAPMAR